MAQVFDPPFCFAPRAEQERRLREDEDEDDAGDAHREQLVHLSKVYTQLKSGEFVYTWQHITTPYRTLTGSRWKRRGGKLMR